MENKGFFRAGGSPHLRKRQKEGHSTNRVTLLPADQLFNQSLSSSLYFVTKHMESWAMASQENSVKTMLKQNFGGTKKEYYGNSKVAYSDLYLLTFAQGIGGWGEIMNCLRFRPNSPLGCIQTTFEHIHSNPPRYINFTITINPERSLVLQRTGSCSPFKRALNYGRQNQQPLNTFGGSVHGRVARGADL